MAEELKDSGAVTALAVIGLVFGLIGTLGSFIPCLGAMAFFISIPAALASGAALIVAYSHKAKRTLAISALTISLIGVVISGLQFFTLAAPSKGLQKVFKLDDSEKKEIIAAHRTISKLAKLEEIYLQREGHYTNDLRTLSDLTGDVNAVRAELFQTLEPDTLVISSDGRKFRITAKARNWRKTDVQVSSKEDTTVLSPE